MTVFPGDDAAYQSPHAGSRLRASAEKPLITRYKSTSACCAGNTRKVKLGNDGVKIVCYNVSCREKTGGIKEQTCF